MSEKDYRIGVLASGEGTTFEAVYNATQGGELADTEVGLVICNNSGAGIWERARRLGVEIWHVSNLTQKNCTLPKVNGKEVGGTISYEASQTMVDLAQAYELDMYVMLGFYKRLIGPVLDEIPTVNTHRQPKLLTAGKRGDDMDKAVMEQNLAYGGPTFHWVDNKLGPDGLPVYDAGQTIGRRPVKITSAMTREYQTKGTAKLLQKHSMAAERLWAPKWIHMALEQL